MVHRPDDIAADLPPPRDDEPASLRQDILDELGDHLRCALDRERQRQAAVSSGVAATPEQRALERFGNPAQLALRLWWDAMREKIMTRRLVFGLALAMMVLGGTVAGVLFQQLLRQQAMMADFQQRMAADAAEQARRHAEQLDAIRRESREASARLVESARAETASAQAALEEARASRELMAKRVTTLEGKLDQPSDWNPAEITLRQSAMDGPPAAGFQVRLSLQGTQSDIPPMAGTSGEDGKVRFERVRYGVYVLRIVAPWKEATLSTVRIQPGESYTATFACPPAAPEPLQGRLRLQLPDDLKTRPLWFRVNLINVSREFAGVRWSTQGPVGQGGSRGSFSSSPNLIFSTDGTLHTPDRPSRMFSSVLDLGQGGEIKGVRIPGKDYHPADGVEFYVKESLVDLQNDPRPQRTLLIPAATLNPDEVVFQPHPADSTIQIVPPERCVAALRKAFQQIDDDVANGREVVSSNAEPFQVTALGNPGSDGSNRPTYLPSKLERVTERGDSFGNR